MYRRHFKSYSVIKEPVLEISADRYKELIEAEIRLKAITEVAEVDNGMYGYTESTSRTIDVLLGIERPEEK